MINDGGILTLLDPESGDVRRRMRLRGGIDHYYASPVAADGKVFFVSQGGAATVLRAGPKAEVLAVNELNEESYATPAIADGRLYVRMAGALYCFGKPTPERQWRVCSRKAAACGLTAHSGSAVICVAICVIPNFGCPKPPVCDSPTSLEHGWTASPGSRSTARNWIIVHALEDYLDRHEARSLAAEARRQSLLASEGPRSEAETWASLTDTTGWT